MAAGGREENHSHDTDRGRKGGKEGGQIKLKKYSEEMVTWGEGEIKVKL